METDSAPTLDFETAIRRARRRGAILDAAEELFIERGYEGTKLAKIVRRSGGSLATLYEIFGNKQGLLHAIAIRWGDETRAERAARGGNSGQSHRDILMSYVRSECEIWQSPRALALLRMLVSEGLRDRNPDLPRPPLALRRRAFRTVLYMGGRRRCADRRSRSGSPSLHFDDFKRHARKALGRARRNPRRAANSLATAALFQPLRNFIAAREAVTNRMRPSCWRASIADLQRTNAGSA